MELIVIQSGGGHTITWPAAIKWVGGSAPVVTSTTTRTDIFTLRTYNSGASWYGIVEGQNLQ